MKEFKLDKILKQHNLWVMSEGLKGERADLKRADLSGSNLRKANLEGADLSGAILRGANLRGTNLLGTNLEGADLSGADLGRADLKRADLKRADLSGANLSGADLKRADLGGAKGLYSQILFLNKNFEKSKNGYVCYKTFNSIYRAPEYWDKKPSSIIEEIVDFDRTNGCSYGINVATLLWVKKNNNYSFPIWKCLIEWEWLAGVCVPYNSDGQIRCEKVQLLEIVDE